MKTNGEEYMEYACVRILENVNPPMAFNFNQELIDVKPMNSFNI